MADYFLDILENPERAFLNNIGASSGTDYQAMPAPETLSISRRE